MNIKKIFLLVMLAILNLPGIQAQMNVVKAGIGEVLSLKPSIQYERVLNERLSAQLTLNYRPSVNIPTIFYEGMMDVSDNPEFSTTNFALYPEVRYYTGFNLPPEGFYVGLQGKYAKSDIHLNGLVLNETNSEVTGHIQSAGAGIQLGYQWLINEEITFDFYFLGLTLQKTNISGTVTSDNPAADYTEMGMSLEESVEDLFFLHRLEVTSESNQLDMRLNGITMGFRTGISFGIAF